MRVAAILLLACLVFLAPAVRAQEDVPEVARTLIEEADRARDAGRLDDAAAKYARAIAVAPALASPYINLGAIDFGRGKVAEAYATFVRGVEHVPTDRTLLSNAAAAAQQLGKSADALQYVDRALARSAKDASLHSLRATILRSLNRNDEALASLQQATQLAPDDAKLQFSLGNLLYAMNRKPDSIEAYRRATFLDPKLLRAWYNLGAVLFESGQGSEALGAYKVALAPIEESFAHNEKVDPIHARAFQNLGAIYLEQKQWKAAADAYAKALRLAPDDATAHYNLGFIAYSTGDDKRAEEEYRKALARDPRLPLAYLHLAQLAQKRGDANGAAQLLEKGLPLLDDDSKPAALRMLGKLALQRGDRATARARYEEVLKAKGDDLESLLLLARMARQEKRAADARPLVTRALAVAPASVPALQERVLLARDGGDAVEERAAIEQLLAVDATSAPFRIELVSLLLRQNAFAEARQQLDALLPTNVASPSLHALHALLLVREGELASAKRDVMNLPPQFALVSAAVQAAAGDRAAALKAAQMMTPSPLADGNAGLLAWQLGAADARARLERAHAQVRDWPEVTLALGELTSSIDLLSAAVATCDIDTPEPRPNALTLAIGQSPDLCARAKSSLANALLWSAGERLARRDVSARALLDRAASLPLDAAQQGVAAYLRGSAELLAGSRTSARDALTRALAGELPSAVATSARANLREINDAEEQEHAASAPAEPVVTTPRRTAVVFLPDLPAESEKKLAETLASFLADVSSQSGVPLQPELFRRADDARAFLAANRDRVGIVIANGELLRDAGGFTPRFRFGNNGQQSYRRVVVVPAKSPLRAVADLRGKSVSGIDLLRDAPPGATFVGVSDDLTAMANVLTGSSDAAIVHEANPLLARHLGRDVRVIGTAGTNVMPIVAFARMPERDRDALLDALRSPAARAALASVQVSTLHALDTEPRHDPKHDPNHDPKRIDVSIVPPSALALRMHPEPPPSLALRVSVDLPHADLPE